MWDVVYVKFVGNTHKKRQKKIFKQKKRKISKTITFKYKLRNAKTKKKLILKDMKKKIYY